MTLPPLWIFQNQPPKCTPVPSGNFQNFRTPPGIITSAEREVKVSRRSGMYQSCIFLTSLGKQSLLVFGSIRLFDEVRAELVRDISRSLRFL